MEHRPLTVYVSNISHFNIAKDTRLTVRSLERHSKMAREVTLERNTGSDVLVEVRVCSMTRTYLRVSLSSGEATLINTGRLSCPHDALTIVRALQQVKRLLPNAGR